MPMASPVEIIEKFRKAKRCALILYGYIPSTTHAGYAYYSYLTFADFLAKRSKIQEGCCISLNEPIHTHTNTYTHTHTHTHTYTHTHTERKTDRQTDSQTDR